MKIRVPFIPQETIWQEADRFRESELLRGYHIPPHDVVFIVEVILKLDIIPLPGLFSDQKIDAALLPDLSGFYVDEETYNQWEKGNHWVERRLRFSLAHELGHYILHKNLIQNAAFETLQEFRSWAMDRTNYQNAEYQADEFSGRFLVPRELLLNEYDTYCRKTAEADATWREIEGMREHLAKKIAPRFGVNHQVIEVRLDREGIWPAE